MPATKCSTVAQVRETLAPIRRAGGRVGFVPTMGALHEGHMSLMRQARAECDAVVVSIFVNPLQFGAHEDLSRYPRPIERDLDLASGVGVDLVFAPSVEEMFSQGALLTSVHVDELSETMEGALRPGHFDGVATVVAKLLNIVGDCRAYFGEKDWQQLAIVRRMVDDLSVPVEIVACPIVRESDGLAMSSRNAYLDDAQRAAALVLNRSLQAGADIVAKGEPSPAQVVEAMRKVLDGQPGVEVDYAEVVGDDLRAPLAIDGEVRLVVAARVGETRLIDNCGASA